MEPNPVAVEGSSVCWQPNVAPRLQPGHSAMNVVTLRKELPVLLPDAAEEICNDCSAVETRMESLTNRLVGRRNLRAATIHFQR